MPTARPASILSPSSHFCSPERLHLSALEKPCSHAKGLAHLRRWLRHSGPGKWRQSGQSLSDNHRKSTCPNRLIEPAHNQVADGTLAKHKVKEALLPMKQLNIIGKCLPKCYLIAWLSLSLSLNLSCNSVPQTNRSSGSRSLLVIYGLFHFITALVLFIMLLQRYSVKYWRARFPVWKQSFDEVKKTPKIVDRFITGKKVSIQIARLLFISAWSKVESWPGSDSHFLRPIIKCDSLASYFYWACTSNKPVGAS